MSLHGSETQVLVELTPRFPEHYVKEDSDVSERIKKLLERKARKTEAGQLLIQDIERLVGEVGIISGAHV